MRTNADAFREADECAARMRFVKLTDKLYIRFTREARAQVPHTTFADWVTANAVEIDNAMDLAGDPDPEHDTRIQAQQCTWELRQKLPRSVDTGRRPIDESPLFGGTRQGSLFDGGTP